MIVTFYAALLAFLYIGLTVYVVRGRMKYNVATGDAGNMDLNRRIRLHGNFAEYAPLGLLLLFFVEAANTHVWFVHILGLMLFIGRLAHIHGLYKNSLGRQIGMGLTLSMMLLSALYLLFGYIF